MATDLRNLPAHLADDAKFREWGSGLAAQLTAVGLVQAADTGQINWTTVTRPAAGAYAGYEIWRFNDALQATKPVFIKIEYGTSASAQDRPFLRTTISTNTNGAGTPTGQVSVTATPGAAASKASGNTLPSYCSGSSSRLNLCTNLDAVAATFYALLFVERTKTSSGADTGDGIVLFMVGAAGTPRFQVIPFSGSVPANGTLNLAASLSSAGISSVGPYVAISPTIAPLGKAYFASWCAYLRADLGAQQVFAADHLGASHSFMALGIGVFESNLVQGSAAGHSLAILWE